jgi:hypothetical protein
MAGQPSRTIFWRRIRISVRAMMIFVLALGAWLGWIAHFARVQRDAVAAITKSGGLVFYDERPWNPVQRGSCGLVRRNWLADLIGVDYLSHVTEVGLDRYATDADLVQIGRLAQLERLSISSSSITDAGLRHLRGLKTLRQLYLHCTPISDGGLAHLDGLGRLQLLTLVDTKVTDAGLPFLRRLHRLRELNVPIAISDRGIRALQNELPGVEINRGLPYK